MSGYKGRPLGSAGYLAALSFHETKTSFPERAAHFDAPHFAEKAKIIREKKVNSTVPMNFAIL